MTLATALASSLAFPGSKTLAGWWRQLATHQPQAFGVGYLFLHRVEAAVQLIKPRRVDPFLLLLLQALDREAPANAKSVPCDLVARLEGRLILNRQVLFQLLRSLESDGLAQERSGAGWGLTNNGRRALADGEYPVQAIDRRTFCFLERWQANGERAVSPHFVGWRGDGGQPWSADECPFDVNSLHECVQRPSEWQSRFDFPQEIQRVVALSSPDAADGGSEESSVWQRVLVDHPERHLTVWALVPGSEEGACLLVFAARQDGWALHGGEPLIRIADGWQEAFSGLTAEPDTASLRHAWKAWASSRGLSDADADAATMSLTGHHLEIQPPAAALDRLKKSKSDVFKGDTWLLVGDGLIRTAVVLRMQ
ncbi:MAG: hypothetical protein FJ271_13905 [Planctomycetes bacterium]|nr:hypothetical protein [Planctomycetota bacterium]